MSAFRVLLVVLWLALLGYTAVVAANHGLGLVPVFFGDIARLGWPGQFNLDFMFMLVLLAAWTAWRNRFSAAGLGLALFALTLGSAFLLPYLLILSLQTGGDMRRVLIGQRA